MGDDLGAIWETIWETIWERFGSVCLCVQILSALSKMLHDVIGTSGGHSPGGVGTLAENSGWAARFVLAEALGLVLVLAQALELARRGGWGGVA